MARLTLPESSDKSAAMQMTAHHTITVEPFEDRHRADVHKAVVERYAGEVVCICCRDVDLRQGATLDAVARAYAVQFEADYVVAVSR